MRGLVLVLLLLVASAARAVSSESQARLHFEAGAALYQTGSYHDAIREFERAKRLESRPAFDFNIARCREKLEEWSAAAAAYQRYLDAAPAAPDRDEIVERVRALRQRVAPPPVAIAPVAIPPVAPVAAPPSPTVTRAARWPLWLLGSLAVGAGAAAAGLMASVDLDYRALESECAQRRCGPDDTAGLRAREGAAWALFGIAGAAVAGEIVLGVLYARHPRARAFVAPAGAGLVAGGRF